MEKNTFKLSQILEIDGIKAQKLLDIISLSDAAAITTAINQNDTKTIRNIYVKYQSQLDSNVNASEVIDFFNDIMNTGTDQSEAIVQTADHFGVTGEEIEAIVADKPVQEEQQPFIPDAKVAHAYNNVQEMIAGKPSRGVITELNAWQRRMFYGLIPNNVAKVIQDTIDMTPIAVMQKHAKEMGYGEPAIKESEMSLAEMMEKIIEAELNRLKDVSDDEEEKPTIVTMDMGTIDPVDEKTKALIKSITSRKF